MTNIFISKALNKLAPGAEWLIHGDDYHAIQWLSQNISQPTIEEIAAEIERLEAQAPIDACKIEAKNLLMATDWVEMPSTTDVTLTPHLLNLSEFTTYRAAVRALAINPVVNPSFPAVPTAQWS